MLPFCLCLPPPSLRRVTSPCLPSRTQLGTPGSPGRYPSRPLESHDSFPGTPCGMCFGLLNVVTGHREVRMVGSLSWRPRARLSVTVASHSLVSCVLLGGEWLPHVKPGGFWDWSCHSLGAACFSWKVHRWAYWMLSGLPGAWGCLPRTPWSLTVWTVISSVLVSLSQNGEMTLLTRPGCCGRYMT